MGKSELMGYRHAYLAFCAVAFIAIVLTAMLKPRQGERSEPAAGAA
jgi:predicted MFS family arabinose efflux permease